VYVVLEAQYQSALSNAVKNINSKNDKVGVGAQGHTYTHTHTHTHTSHFTCRSSNTLLQSTITPARTRLRTAKDVCVYGCVWKHHCMHPYTSIDTQTRERLLEQLVRNPHKPAATHTSSKHVHKYLNKHAHRCALRLSGTCWRSCVTTTTWKPSGRMWRVPTSLLALSFSLRS